MRYLQYNTLHRLGLGHFDSWAAAFGETQTVVELAPEGTGYRPKKRFARFYNLPELTAIFKECADIQTADMLKLPVPEAEYENVVLKPSPYQKEMVEALAERAEAVRSGGVEPQLDNMLKITNDGRKLALEQRLIDPALPDDENSKINACVKRAFKIWEETRAERCTQLIFCDLSTPKAFGSAAAGDKMTDALADGTVIGGSTGTDTAAEPEIFTDVYTDIKQKLIKKGVPPKEIAFIHEANTEIKKAELFGRVRSGRIRFLLGSTQKMGAGTNVQDRLIALHHLDVPWRPADIEQQEGRILRQGNKNPKVRIFRYVTEGTFDAYSWQVIENKQKFISQIMTGKSPVRSCDDIDGAALSYAEVKALATGNPLIKEKMDLDVQVARLRLLKGNHNSQIYRLEDCIAYEYPKKIALLRERISGLAQDIGTAEKNLPADSEHFLMKVGSRVFTDKKEAGTALMAARGLLKDPALPEAVGEYAGFSLYMSYDAFRHVYILGIRGVLNHSMEMGQDASGCIVRINNVLAAMPKELSESRLALDNAERQLETAREEVKKPFEKEAELDEKLKRLAQLNSLLNLDKKESAVVMDCGGEEFPEGEDMDNEPKEEVRER